MKNYSIYFVLSFYLLIFFVSACSLNGKKKQIYSASTHTHLNKLNIIDSSYVDIKLTNDNDWILFKNKENSIHLRFSYKDVKNILNEYIDESDIDSTANPDYELLKEFRLKFLLGNVVYYASIDSKYNFSLVHERLNQQ